MALKLGVKSAIKQKLHKRQQNCHTKLKTESRDAGIQDQICNVLESEHVSVTSSAESGRFLEANEAVKPGEVLATEDPFSSLLDEKFKLTHCSHCFRETASFIPCYWCTAEGYCSEECLDAGWSKYHWLECERVSQLRSLGSHAQLCLRTAAQFSSGDYETVFSLLTHKEELLGNPSHREAFEEIAVKLVAMFGDSIRNASLPVKELFLHHLLQLRCNTLAVSSLSGRFLSTEQQSGSNVQDKYEVKLGSALYPTLSLINHSCRPNAILRFMGNRASLCATRLIKAGEEVNISYGPQAGRADRAQRQAELKGKYFFNCSCTACKNILYEVQDSLLCTSCSGAIIKYHDSALVSCLACKHTPADTKLHYQAEMRRKASGMYKSAVVQQPYNLPLLLECHQLQSMVLYRDNMELGRTSDKLAERYAMQGDFATSARYCAASCQAVGVAYGEDSIELGNELFKLAQLQFNSGGLAEALRTARRSRDIMLTHYGTHHSECQALEQLIKTVENKL
ncbi:SET and MYND domain-containing protein 4-like isoform X2 [Halichondria panicea]